jgi:cyanophycinase
MIKRLVVFAYLFFFILTGITAQRNTASAKGSLFIIGGGKRTPQLMQTMLSTAKLKPKDYIVVLPMSSAEPDTAFYYFKISVEKFCANSVVNLNFTAGNATDK